ncbi:hypothetical protein [Streptomyces sp. NPDC058371]|uniref:hypothetical protein n=1 Tax=Streptomyces sp. NPDC058371 TaxID=3346463 RepID=UPI003668C241
MPTRSISGDQAGTTPKLRHGWHKLLFALFLLSRARRIPAAIDSRLGTGPSGWWTVLWVLAGLGLAAYAVSEWEILRASSWQMRPPQWICMVLFHIGFTGFVIYVVLGF